MPLITVLLLFAMLALPGCGRQVRGEPSAEGSEFDGLQARAPASVIGSTGAVTDVLAADVIAGVETYWRTTSSSAFGRPWANIHGFLALNPATATTVPCLAHASYLAGQALYCPDLDVIAWDRTGLLPRLAHDYGPGAVVVALAHEIGHAIENRLATDSVNQTGQPERYPTILLEGMADCYAGSAMHAVVSGQVPRVAVSRPDLDRALRALLSLRDPIGLVGTRPTTSHGDAFDRASAFIDGYADGPSACMAMRVENNVPAQRGYGSIADEVTGGNLPLPDLERLLGPDVSAWFGQLISQHGGLGQPPALSRAHCSTPAASRQGPAALCPAERLVGTSNAPLTSIHDSLGDYASGAIMVSRYAFAALEQLGRPTVGADASHRALCLTGAYTRAIFDRQQGFALSPGDIDEAVNELLTHDYAARDLTGRPPPNEFGFERVTHFRDGVRGGPSACGL